MKERPIIMTAESVRAILDGRKSQTRRVVSDRTCRGNVKASELYLDGNPFDAEQPGPWIDPGPSPAGNPGPYLRAWVKDYTDRAPDRIERLYPWVFVGDRLWVRETARLEYSPARNSYRVAFRDGRSTEWGVDIGAEWSGSAMWLLLPATGMKATSWRPSIHMPRWACRLVLEVTEVRVQRVQEISYEDALAEGMADGAALCESQEPGRVSSSGETAEQVARRLEWPQRNYREAWDALNAKRGYSWESNPWVWAISFRVVA